MIIERLFVILFIYNEAPADCFGSKEHVSEWVLHGGLKVEVADV